MVQIKSITPKTDAERNRQAILNRQLTGKQQGGVKITNDPKIVSVKANTATGRALRGINQRQSGSGTSAPTSSVSSPSGANAPTGGSSPSGGSFNASGDFVGDDGNIYKKGSDAYNLVVGKLGEKADFAKELGLTAGPSTITGLVSQHEARQAEDRQYQESVLNLESEIESDRFRQGAAQARSAGTAAEANFAQDREGPVGSSAMKLVQNFQGRIESQIGTQRKVIELNQLKRDRLRLELERAQADGDAELAESIQGQIAMAEQNIRNAENKTMELANENVKLSLDLQNQQAAARKEAFDFFDSLPAGSFEGMEPAALADTLGVDIQTAGILSALDRRRSALQETDPEYLKKKADLDASIKEAKWAGMTTDQKNFEYYKQLKDTNPAMAEKFANQTGINKTQSYTDYNKEVSQNVKYQNEIFANTGVWTPINSKYEYTVANGGISFEASVPSGSVLSSRGECGEFTNDILNGGPGLFGDSFKQKMTIANAQGPIAGGAFVEDTGDNTGHVGVIERVYGDGSFDIRECNYVDSKTVSTAHIAVGSARWNTIAEKGGFYDPSKVGQPSPENDPVEQQAQAIFSSTSATTSGLSTKDNFRGQVEERLAQLQAEAREKGDIEGVIRGSAGGAKPDASFITSFQKGKVLVNQMDELVRNLTQEGIKEAEKLEDPDGEQVFDFGPIKGWLKQKNPWDTDAQELTAILQGAIPNLARGIYGEVGVLTDRDIELYRKTLPNLQQTEDVQKAVAGLTLRVIKNSLVESLLTQADNGRNVSGNLRYLQQLDGKMKALEGDLGIVSEDEEPQFQYTLPEDLQEEDPHANFL